MQFCHQYSDCSYAEGKIRMAIVIREARLEDSADIVQLISEHAQATGEGSPLTVAYVAHYLTSPISTILLAETNQRIVGLLSWSLRPDLFHAGNACLIEELVVQEGLRDQGIGGALMKGLFTRLAGRGCA